MQVLTPKQIDQLSAQILQQQGSGLNLQPLSAPSSSANYTGYRDSDGVWIDAATGEPRKEPPSTIIPEPGKDEPTMQPQDNFGIQCPPRETLESRSYQAGALQRIERDPVVIGAGTSIPGGFEGDTGVTFNADNAIGMYLCEMEATLDVTYNGAGTWEAAEKEAFLNKLKAQIRITLTFRDQKVETANYIRLGTMVWTPECCDGEHCISSILPDYGVLNAEIENVPLIPGAEVEAVDIELTIRANPCECSCNRKSCGC